MLSKSEKEVQDAMGDMPQFLRQDLMSRGSSVDGSEVSDRDAEELGLPGFVKSAITSERSRSSADLSKAHLGFSEGTRVTVLSIGKRCKGQIARVLGDGSYTVLYDYPGGTGLGKFDKHEITRATD